MFQRRSHRTAPRPRSLALGGGLAALAVVGGGTVVAVTAPTAVDTGDIQLAQNAEDQTAAQAGAQELPLGTAVNLDLEPVVAQAAGGTVPAGTTVQLTGLPDGLTQDGWVISGTPTRAGEYEVLVTVSNAGVSQSEKVAITVTDGAGGAGESTTTSPSAETAPQPDPTLSAVPGDPTADDDEVGTAPDLCAVVEDGQLDGASLAQLVPLLTGGDDAETSGLVMVLVNTVANLLPSVLGEGGSLENLGSAGQFLCTLSPELLGGESGGTAATGGDATVTDGTTTDAAAPGGPAALLGLLTAGAGSLGQ